MHDTLAKFTNSRSRERLPLPPPPERAILTKPRHPEDLLFRYLNRLAITQVGTKLISIWNSRGFRREYSNGIITFIRNGVETELTCTLRVKREKIVESV